MGQRQEQRQKESVPNADDPSTAIAAPVCTANALAGFRFLQRPWPTVLIVREPAKPDSSSDSDSDSDSDRDEDRDRDRNTDRQETRTGTAKERMRTEQHDADYEAARAEA